MKVWLATYYAYDDGYIPLGVFSTAQKAAEAAEAHRAHVCATDRLDPEYVGVSDPQEFELDQPWEPEP